MRLRVRFKLRRAIIMIAVVAMSIHVSLMVRRAHQCLSVARYYDAEAANCMKLECALFEEVTKSEKEIQKQVSKADELEKNAEMETKSFENKSHKPQNLSAQQSFSATMRDIASKTRYVAALESERLQYKREAIQNCEKLRKRYVKLSKQFYYLAFHPWEANR